jgi:hypothetical protein
MNAGINRVNTGFSAMLTSALDYLTALRPPSFSPGWGDPERELACEASFEGGRFRITRRQRMALERANSRLEELDNLKREAGDIGALTKEQFRIVGLVLRFAYIKSYTQAARVEFYNYEELFRQDLSVLKTFSSAFRIIANSPDVTLADNDRNELKRRAALLAARAAAVS